VAKGMITNINQWNDVLSRAVQSIAKPSVYVNNQLTFEADEAEIWEFVMDQVKSKYPEKSQDIFSELMFNPLFSFDTEDEAIEFFNIFNVRGKTYASEIYACWYSAHGEPMSENT